MNAPEKILLEMDADGDIEGFYTDFCAEHESENGVFYVREDLSGWRPLAEAPLDGTSVLVGLAGCKCKHGGVAVARYSSIGMKGVEKWNAAGRIVEPTHFRILPEPPRAES